MSDITLRVYDNMQLTVTPEDVGRDAENAAATFRIARQPTDLDALACRAEITNRAGTTYRVVTNGAFPLTSDIAVHGHGRLQLVYGDGTVSRKTTVANFRVDPSLNAVDQSDPDFQDGLAQVQAAAFAQAEIQGSVLAFRNIGGMVVDTVNLPGGGADLDANYLRRDGANQMRGSVLIEGENRGVVFDWQGISAAIYSDATTMRLRRPVSNADITIEDNNGTPASRSAVMTLSATDLRYLQLTGGTMPGTITFGVGQGLAFQPAGSAMQEQSGALVARHGAGQFSPILTAGDGDYRYLSVAGGTVLGPLTAVGWPSPPDLSHLVTRSWVEGATVSSANGGQVSGVLFMGPNAPFISAMGVGGQPMLCIGSNDSGFWRTGGSVVFEVGRTPVAIYSATNTSAYVPLNLLVQPTLAAHATTKLYVDNVRAPSLFVAMGSPLPLSGAFQTVVSFPYSIPRGGNSRVLVTLSAGLSMANAGQICVVQVRCLPSDLVQNIFAYGVLDGGNTATSGAHLSFPVDVTGTNPTLGVEMRIVGTPPGGGIIVEGGAGSPQRATVTFQDLGAR